MIERGFLHVGEYFQTQSGGEVPAPGRRPDKALPDGNTTNIHTGAALAKKSKAERLNGFTFWYVRRGDRFVGIDVIRKRPGGTITRIIMIKVYESVN